MLLGTLGPNTFRELRIAFEAANQEPPLLPMLSRDEWSGALKAAGWAIECEEVEEYRTAHASLLDLLRYIKLLGARNKQSLYPLMRGKEWLQQLECAFPNKSDNHFNLSWEVIVFKLVKL